MIKDDRPPSGRDTLYCEIFQVAHDCEDCNFSDISWKNLIQLALVKPYITNKKSLVSCLWSTVNALIKGSHVVVPKVWFQWALIGSPVQNVTCVFYELLSQWKGETW